jgi:hypothetical protein
MLSLHGAARLAAAAALLGTIGCVLPAAAAEEGKITAFATWEGRGDFIQTGDKQQTFTGALVGVIYVLTDHGPTPSGSMICPVAVEVNQVDSSQTAKGHCTITAEDGSRIYSDLACTGFQLVGCAGDMKLTGGSGRFAGISGGGKVVIRSGSRTVVAGKSDVATPTQGTGTAYWESLEYKIP